MDVGRETLALCNLPPDLPEGIYLSKRSVLFSHRLRRHSDSSFSLANRIIEPLDARIPEREHTSDRSPREETRPACFELLNRAEAIAVSSPETSTWEHNEGRN